MRRLLILLFAQAMAFVSAVLGQTENPASCPSVSVIGPAGISLPGETIYFHAAIDPNRGSYKRLHWTVSDGTIISGQNTLRLGVRMPKRPPVTATILVEGLPKECPDSALDRYDFAIDPGSILIDQFGPRPRANIQMRLNKLFRELQKSPE
jgi:hypothetical protein